MVNDVTVFDSVGKEALWINGARFPAFRMFLGCTRQGTPLYDWAVRVAFSNPASPITIRAHSLQALADKIAKNSRRVILPTG